MKNSLSEVLTAELIQELKSRNNVQAFSTELYSGYNVSIVKKFSEDRMPVQLPVKATVLVIEG